MSSPSSEKHGKAKSKKSTSKGSKSLKGGKGDNVNVDKFRGDGMNFKCKLLGVAEVDGPRGDTMCLEALKKLKILQRQSGEHKRKIIVNVSLMGIRILEEKTKNILFEHPVNKVSFITHDPDDKKIFSFISSAKCSDVAMGHMMYAIKYDKLAGIITSTLYELFQAVFKLRQEAALKQRRALQETQPTFQNNSTPTSHAGMANGPDGASNVNDNNIYEEPSASATSPSSAVKEENTNENIHYQVPAPRPLPPAPYASTSHQTNSLPRPKENDEDSTPNQTVSSTSEHFFSSSVFTQAEHTADNISEASFDIHHRKGSVSSSISSTSETASHDFKNMELKSVSVTCTPPAIPRSRHATTNSTGHAQGGLALEGTPVAEDDDHYETIPSSDYEVIPSDLVAKETKKTEPKPAATEFAFKESFSDESFPFETEKKSNGHADLFATPEKPEPSLKKSNGSPPSSAVFGNDDFFSSAFDEKVDTAHAPATDFPVDDPFAPSSNATSTEANSGNLFASGDAFESAFGPARDSTALESPENDQSEKETNPEKSEKSESDAFGRFDDAFGASDMSTAFKTSESSNEEKQSNEKSKEELSWGNTLENSEQKESKSDISWCAAFGDNEVTKDQNGEKKNSSEGAKVSFDFDDSFGANFDEEQKDNGQQPDKVAAEPDISWTNAFNEKSQKEVTFSWDDAFGAADDKDGKTDTKLSKFDTMSFDDAFASTPFKPVNNKDSDVKVKDGLPSFGNALTPIKPDESQSETAEKKEDIAAELSEEVSKDGGMDSKSNEKDLMESNNKDSMDSANRDSSNKEEEKINKQVSEESSNEVSKKPIPQIIEPPRDEDSDVEDEPVKPSRLPVLPNKNNEGETSPTAPPPLPPRAMAPLPTLPPRPRTSSSPMVGAIPPTPPRPVSAGTPKSGTTKRLPPALPPRIDLETKGRSSSESTSSSSTVTSDPFNSPSNAVTESNKSWEVQWPDETGKDNKKQNDSSSKNSPDPFGDDFFTDFDFNTATKSNGTNTEIEQNDNSNSFNDPFASKEAGKDIFKTDFDGVDPFADFSSGSKSVDPFASDGSDMFAPFSSTHDPFADSADPFANKGTLGDPFDVSPKKDSNDQSMSFQLKNSDDDEFADSFA